MNIALIMLAAGNSRRFGSNKLLFPVDGRPMYQITLDRLKQIKADLSQEFECKVIVVTQYEEIRKYASEEEIQVLINPHPEKGISFSIQIGLREHQDADACLFAVSDQPWMTTRTIENMIRAFLRSGKGIGCPAFGQEGKTGNPCIFKKTYYRELMELEGDTGGKKVIRQHLDDTFVYELKDEKQLEDIDVPLMEKGCYERNGQ